MTMNMTRFLEELGKDQKAITELEKHERGTAAEDLELVTKLAQRYDIELTKEDLRSLSELDEEELLSASGGVGNVSDRIPLKYFLEPGSKHWQEFDKGERHMK